MPFMTRYPLCFSGMATCQISLSAAVYMSFLWTFMRNMGHWSPSGLEGVLLSASAPLISWNNIWTPTGRVSGFYILFGPICSGLLGIKGCMSKEVGISFYIERKWDFVADMVVQVWLWSCLSISDQLLTAIQSHQEISMLVSFTISL